MSTRGDTGKEVVGDPKIRLTRSLLDFEIKSPQKNFNVDPVDDRSLEQRAESPVCGLLDYFGMKMKESILIEKNLMTLWEKYDILDEYKMLVLGRKVGFLNP